MNRYLSHAFAAFAAVLALAAAPLAVAQPKCPECGRVDRITYVEEKGKGSGLGMLGGAVVGGVLGHQLGSGTGNTVATVAGAAGGAYVGNEVEKNHNKSAYWSVAIRMDGGETRSFTYGSKPAVREGDRVKLVDGGRRLALLAN